MTYFVYLIGSYKKLKLTTYVGYTNNLKKRLDLHNKGKGAKFTRGRKWKLIYKEKGLWFPLNIDESMKELNNALSK